MKLYIHDDGSVTCKDHAPISLLAEINTNPGNRLYWTPRGTWQAATQTDRHYFKQGTGLDLACETCSPILTRAEVNA